jgi:regulator of replication initiation timing
LAKAAVASRGVDLEPIDRLEEKIRLLVGMIERMRSETERAASENTRLVRELEAARARLADGDAVTAEATALREERELIRSRVNDMLAQIDALNL